MAFLNQGLGSEEELPSLKGEGRACSVDGMQRPCGDCRRGIVSGRRPLSLKCRE